MTTLGMDTQYGKSSDFDAFAVSLNRCLKRHAHAFEDEGIACDFKAIVKWTDAVYAGSVGALEALEEYGPENLSNLKDRIFLAFEEQQRASAEFPGANKSEDRQQDRYAVAYRDVSNALDQLIKAVIPLTQAPTIGEVQMKLVAPKDDGQKIDVGIKKESRSNVAQALGAMLASTYTLYVKSLFYHWNVTGPQFHGLHVLFEDHYQNLHEAGDELAERIRALGHFTPGTLESFAALSVVKDDEKLPKDAKGMLLNLKEAHELCAGEARRVLEVAEEAGDEVTADMMVDRMRFHDESIWMLSASL
ncbi:Dps family protein [Kordiimonas pumila]|uniref:Dps family protein n=1 Tax=Kordiimonas pumila TaxID=2161677 RepID=A0ABV7D364_9PROT|nr:DNA starvation/stationary phase protection protein [Kordiimonas pumila]